MSAGEAGVWAWADRFSKAIHARARAGELSRKIATRECGDCRLWMTKQCPRERSDISGFSRGPSCGGMPCAEFVEKPYVTKLRAQWRVEMEALNAAH